MPTIILSVIAAIFATVTVILFKAVKRIRAEYEKKIKELEAALTELTLEIKERRLKEDELLVRKTEAETKFASLKEQLARHEADVKRLVAEKENLIEEKNHQQQEKELARQMVTTIKQQMAELEKTTEQKISDWEKTKEEHLQAATASVMEAGSKLSSKLLDDHKREMEEAKKQSEKTVKETTDELHNKFKNVFESMNVLHEKVNDNSSTVDLVKRSLLSPSGAGHLAEITLENIFKASGLIENQDYQMQYHMQAVEGSDSLRPDAVVFLPANNVMIVDSKASKFFVEIGENAESTDAADGLKKTMNTHLKDLISRNYREAIEKQLGEVTATMLMFLPTETALEKLRKTDPMFMDKAWKERILPVGPTGLVNALLQAKILISNAKQEQNSKQIINQVKDLLGSIARLTEMANSVGKGLRSTFNKYDDFAGSFNRTFLSKAKKIQELGADMPKLKDVAEIERYSVDSRQRYKAIELTAEDEVEVKQLAEA